MFKVDSVRIPKRVKYSTFKYLFGGATIRDSCESLAWRHLFV